MGQNEDRKVYDFFDQLLALLDHKTSIFDNISPLGYQRFLPAGTGISGVMWELIVFDSVARIDIKFCTSSHEVNQENFNAIFKHKDEIEEIFAESLIWDFKENRKWQFIRSQCPIGAFKDEEKWTLIQEDLVDRLLRMEKAFFKAFEELR